MRKINNVKCFCCKAVDLPKKQQSSPTIRFKEKTSTCNWRCIKSYVGFGLINLISLSLIGDILQTFLPLIHITCLKFYQPQKVKHVKFTCRSMFHFTCKQTTLLSSPYVASEGVKNNLNWYHNTKYYHKMFYENWEVQNANFCAALNC